MSELILQSVTLIMTALIFFMTTSGLSSIMPSLVMSAIVALSISMLLLFSSRQIAIFLIFEKKITPSGVFLFFISFIFSSIFSYIALSMNILEGYTSVDEIINKNFIATEKGTISLLMSIMINLFPIITSTLAIKQVKEYSNRRAIEGNGNKSYNKEEMLTERLYWIEAFFAAALFAGAFIWAFYDIGYFLEPVLYVFAIGFLSIEILKANKGR